MTAVLGAELDVAASSGTMTLQVVAAVLQASSITSYELARTDGGVLPAWEPGAHIDVHLPSGTVRQYSLCGDPADRSRYRIAVLEITDGRGGSVEVHRELRPGRQIEISSPRSNFELIDAPAYVFVAGGIGITPILPMIRTVAQRGLPWELIYGARSVRHFAFADELAVDDSGAVRYFAQETDGHIDLESVVAGSSGAAVYCCGPTGLMDALTDAMSAAGRVEDLYIERFAPVAQPVDENAGDFTVELTLSGVSVDVSPDQSILDAVRAAGVDAPSSCEMGICGTCETKVVAGDVDHRDDLLTEDERATCGSMMICVSRACGKKLVLEL
ncbi:oxidoreductase [Gordonia sp. TBRC 11910]|uniref:Oxidoreductase n=1 Tax=Gordonia asplenii TaxID=2725283 RepID=A0A848KV79_9ACTN|nr:PDR/VanB family oxidoreductase [Gordonia asplenii]NMO01947.1 oxidoreductase [Gordonia asplenii]